MILNRAQSATAVFNGTFPTGPAMVTLKEFYGTTVMVATDIVRNDAGDFTIEVMGDTVEIAGKSFNNGTAHILAEVVTGPALKERTKNF